MMNHYFFIRQLAFALHERLRGAQLLAVRSPQLDELHLSFEQAGSFWLLRLNWQTDLSLLSWEQFDESPPLRSYEKQLFPAWGQQVQAVRAVQGERLICFQLASGDALWLKLFGRMGNALLWQQEAVQSVFRRSRQQDFKFDPSQFTFDEPSTPWAPEKMTQLRPDPVFAALPPALQQTWFSAPSFRISENKIAPEYTNDTNATKDVLTLSTAFFRTYVGKWLLDQTRTQLLKQLSLRIQKVEKRWSEAQAQLQQLAQQLDYEQQGHLLMAHAYAIAPGTDRVVLTHWDHPNRPVEIKLQAKLSAVENANRLYQKAKKQHIEREKLAEYLETLDEELQQLRHQHAQVLAAERLRDLNKFKQEAAKAALHLPWRSFELDGMEVWIGKNDAGNDEMLRRAHKDDVWMHARQLAGSHLLIRSAGRKTSQRMLETAASWAAWYSKGRNEQLCPVMYTARKFVRKPKGAAPGAVIVSRESVLLVAPSAPTLPNQ
jgi:predicted ribosome quality control (RQC) complex YloA/Tae2 family protein